MKGPLLSTEMIVVLGGLLVTPLLGAIAKLFYEVVGLWKARYQDAKSDNEKLQATLDATRKESIPAMASIQDSQKRIVDLVEVLDKRLERLEDKIGR